MLVGKFSNSKRARFGATRIVMSTGVGSSAAIVNGTVLVDVVALCVGLRDCQVDAQLSAKVSAVLHTEN